MKRLTPAQRHQQRVRAAQEAASPETAANMAGATTYELQLMQLKQDQSRLKQIQSISARNKLKPELLPQYDAYLDGILQADQGQQDEVLTTVMVWHFDTASWARGLQLAAYVLKHNIKLPDRFQRTPATLVAEEVANAALAEFRTDGDFDGTALADANALTADHDMPDEVRAKLLFAMALATSPSEESTVDVLTTAKELLTEAIRLHGRVGAKRDLEHVDRWLKKHADSHPEPEPTPEPPAQDETSDPEPEPEPEPSPKKGKGKATS